MRYSDVIIVLVIFNGVGCDGDPDKLASECNTVKHIAELRLG